eukprot:g63375.t1
MKHSCIQRKAPYGNLQTHIQSRVRIAQYLPYLGSKEEVQSGVALAPSLKNPHSTTWPATPAYPTRLRVHPLISSSSNTEHYSGLESTGVLIHLGTLIWDGTSPFSNTEHHFGLESTVDLYRSIGCMTMSEQDATRETSTPPNNYPGPTANNTKLASWLLENINLLNEKINPNGPLA